jgi:hypothetical protein
MAEQRYEIGVIVARRALTSPWADHAWAPHAVLSAAAPIAPWTKLGDADYAAIFYAGASELALHSSVTAHYRDNLLGGQPSLWVCVRPLDRDLCVVTAVTADPYEGEALTEGLGSIVEPVAMPPILQATIADFVTRFHVERPFFKRERDRADADALGFRPGGLEEE